MNADSLIVKDVTLPDGTISDLFIADGMFVAEAPPAASVIDGKGLIAMPGLIDPHTHLREPGNEVAETIATGTLAAARGGFVCVMAMPNTTPATNGPAEAEWVVKRAVATAHAAVVPIGAVTYDRSGERLADIVGLAESSARVRMFSDDGACVPTEQLLRAAMEAMKPYGGVIAEHAQDAAIAGATACCGADTLQCADAELPVWPREAEWRIVERDVRVAEEIGGRIHICHISTIESLEVIRRAKARGVRVSAEATPHHLLLGSELVTGSTPPNTTYKVNPPLRPCADVLALREAVADGTIDVIGTDHAPHAHSDKAKAFPEASPGMTGLECALGVVIETLVNPGLIGWTDVARLMSHAPAKLAQLGDLGQPIAVGNRANLTLINPTRRTLINRDNSASKARNNPYHGMELPDPVEYTIWAGQITFSR